MIYIEFYAAQTSMLAYVCKSLDVKQTLLANKQISWLRDAVSGLSYYAIKLRTQSANSNVLALIE